MLVPVAFKDAAAAVRRTGPDRRNGPLPKDWTGDFVSASERLVFKQSSLRNYERVLPLLQSSQTLRKHLAGSLCVPLPRVVKPLKRPKRGF